MNGPIPNNIMTTKQALTAICELYGHAPRDKGDLFDILVALSEATEERRALETIAHSLSNCPCMSREAQKGFEMHKPEDEYRVELAGVIIEARNTAYKALASTSVSASNPLP